MEEVFSFSGHQSFPFRHTWLTKGVVHCAEDPSVFTRADAMVTLGVGKNMVQSIRHWCLATRVLEENPEVKNNRGRQLRPSDIGRRIFLTADAWDPYLEDVGTLWLLHWLLATNGQRATTWHFVFNSFHQPEFTRNGLEEALARRFQGLPNARFTPDTLRRDVDVFIRTYVSPAGPAHQMLEDSLDCPLVELRLLIEQSTYGVFSIPRAARDTLPDAILLFSLWDFVRKRPERTITFDDLQYGTESPGQIFKLDESALAERLDRIADLTRGAWQFSETAGLKQLLISRDIDAMAILDGYYRRTPDVEPGVAR